MSQRPVIGIFDSGFGGLTVMRSLLHLVPQADYVYLGDTARLPYGAKSQTTIARYAVESARFLVDGQPRETLAGHADLLRTYPSRDTTVAITLPDAQ